MAARLTDPDDETEKQGRLAITDTDLEELFRQAPSFFAVLSGPDHVFERVNEAYTRLVGNRPVVGKPLLQALPELDGQGFDRLLDEVYASGEAFVSRAHPAKMIRTPGAEPEQIYVDFTYKPVLDSQGRVTRVIVHGSDVTEQVVARKDAEERAVAVGAQVDETKALADELELSNDQLQKLNIELEEARDTAEESRAHLSEVLVNLADSVSVLDLGWRWTFINPAAAAVLRELGKHPDELIGRELWQEFPNLAGSHLDLEGRRAVKENTIVEYEEFFAALGRWYETRIVPSPHRITIFARDVTTRHQAQAELRASEEQFRTAVNAIPTLSWIANADGWIFWYNHRWYEYTGTNPADMEGWGWQSVHDPELLPSVLERWTGSIATGEPFEMEFPLRGADGKFRWFLTRGSPLRDPRGKIQKWFGTNTDVHLQREATEAAKSANKAKSDFLAAMSHETRQPINATLGFLDVLEMGIYGEVPEKQREALSRIRANQEQLLAVITDILSFARLEAGHVKLQCDRMLCEDILETIPALVEPQVAARELSLVIEPCSPAFAVSGDRNRILQIATNLITNSARATASGGVIKLRFLPR